MLSNHARKCNKWHFGDLNCIITCLPRVMHTKLNTIYTKMTKYIHQLWQELPLIINTPQILHRSCSIQFDISLVYHDGVNVRMTVTNLRTSWPPIQAMSYAHTRIYQRNMCQRFYITSITTQDFHSNINGVIHEVVVAHIPRPQLSPHLLAIHGIMYTFTPHTNQVSGDELYATHFAQQFFCVVPHRNGFCVSVEH